MSCGQAHESLDIRKKVATADPARGTKRSVIFHLFWDAIVLPADEATRRSIAPVLPKECAK
jgi:hypothetical protein